MTYATGSWGEKAKLRAKTRNEYFRIYRYKRNPIKIKARRALEYACKKGIIIKQPCEVCNDKKSRIEAHHEDYGKPLEVKWFCPKHHREADRKLGLRK